MYDGAYNLEDIVEIKTEEELIEMMGEVSVSGEDREREEGVDRQSHEEERGESRFRGGRGGERERGRPEREERPEKEERPREGGRSEREERPKQDDDSEVPKEYRDCFGVSNGQLEKCEDCPKKLWQECYKKTAESRQPKGGRRRDL